MKLLLPGLFSYVVINFSPLRHSAVEPICYKREAHLRKERHDRMATDNLVSLPLFLPLSWWRRLQRIARHCATSPGEFAREVLEAEIVRRELLIEPGENPPLDWLGESNAPTSTQLH